MVAKTYEEPNYGTDSPDVYKGKLDQNAAAHNLITGQFAPHEASTPDMTVLIDSARVSDGVSVTVVAQQITSVITAPVTNPRIDRIVIDALTGAYSIVTGTESVSPVAPDITAGKNACCQIALATSTTAITNSLITDERVLLTRKDSLQFITYSGRTEDVSSTAVNPQSLCTAIDQASSLADAFFILSGTIGYQYRSAIKRVFTGPFNYQSKSFNFSAQNASPQSIRISNDGSKMYMLGLDDVVYQYTLSTPYDISTCSYASLSFSLATQSTNTGSICFNNDGSKLYALDANNSIVYQYTLSTSWDVSSAAYDSLSVNLGNNSGNGIILSADGRLLFTVDDADVIIVFELSSANDISTAVELKRYPTISGAGFSTDICLYLGEFLIIADLSLDDVSCYNIISN